MRTQAIKSMQSGGHKTGAWGSRGRSEMEGKVTELKMLT